MMWSCSYITTLCSCGYQLVEVPYLGPFRVSNSVCGSISWRWHQAIPDKIPGEVTCSIVLECMFPDAPVRPPALFRVCRQQQGQGQVERVLHCLCMSWGKKYTVNSLMVTTPSGLVLTAARDAEQVEQSLVVCVWLCVNETF